MNHICGLHACALATVAEFAAGTLLVSHLGPDKYRLLMERLEIDYRYQGKSNAVARCSLSERVICDDVITPLLSEASLRFPVPVEVSDADGNILCTAIVHWHIKPWNQVRTAMKP
jgi:hypothetical protein